ncbi:MAG: 3-deoxy-7-phosphoheptulonate synthase [Omnitrophica bacterium RIFCSPLOWO2_12_FULL_44_17]|uniref:3-deoxy-7-phosphoheptulonate synthase n=1 Tax=Candidatus Danuiimicrobium aquiferis TaxID=1801832 RepID=A0A1G1L1G8_9BACT|nr:MAG: 3-deoxy-7-phosphoheptulonate synthase [Omnitrophica bacterium RIFCSPHIGHO2_02_FULL_45_28]OGW89953.1 MAG: 3-deoxy-7-phosphoheptulonate synthase [Omnitrophica bacterium RIFCSPHIGHO2_12_FULL_44_12]OGW99003.1 MAG: 3-deoxy-7-phosphoheptulonate synthase [Omnitrophica bacterium RIFCSPLOWO2_12_FULL_44_17]OGX04182.1 MAG: 3-deoxy-7-phosphoheptulonate synthase [Omnitrophica bacterium RIFCSPLOWO2_02_FULL_44_11]
MIIVLKQNATPEQINHICNKVKELGLTPQVSRGIEKTIIGVIGQEDKLRVQPLEAFPGVERVMSVMKPYKLASRDFKSEDTIFVMDNGVKVGGKQVVIMGGPCTVENKESLLRIAKEVKKSGATFLRGGAFKPRSSPYSFQGLGEEGLKYLREVADEVGLLVVTEVMDTRAVELVSKYADMLQIGARNMQNFDLLKEIGRTKKPTLLKRGLSATIKELLLSAEYLLSNGNFKVMLCERGIRTFETATRNTLDINAIPVLKEETHLPVLVDPSHGTGNYNYVTAVARAAVAAGADGIMVEVHDNPEEAASDGEQSLVPKRFDAMVKELRAIAHVLGREV